VSRSLLLVLPLSLALHAGAALAVLTLLPHESTLSPLFIDLTLPESSALPTPAPQPRSRDRAASPRAARSMTAVRQASEPLSSPSASVVPSSARAVIDEARPEHEERVAEAPITGSSESIAPVSGATETEHPADAPAVRSGLAASVDGGLAGNDLPGGRTSGVSASAGRPSDAAALATGPGGGDGPGAEYGPYLAGVRRQIAESLQYPLAARRRRLTGTVQLEIVIRANGSIAAADVVQSSMHAILDDAALGTVKALPRMPFPPDVPARQLRVRLPIIFTLE
jgi:protein TonB